VTETTKLYNDSVTLEFNTDKHIYSIVSDDGNRAQIPSVTAMTGMIDNGKSNALTGWAAKVVAEYARTQLKPGVALDEMEIVRLLVDMKKAPKQFKDDAASLGTLVHEWIEKYILYRIDLANGERSVKPKIPVNSVVKGAVAGFLKWEEEHKVEYVFAERKVVSIQHWYAGTLDILAVVNGRLCILDIKTSNGVRDEYFIQTAGYALALEEEYAEDKEFKADGGIEGRVILHVDKSNGVVTPYDADDPESRARVGSKQKLNVAHFPTWLAADTAAFLAARQLHRWAKGL
jgi:hypothetical protein